MHFFLDVLVNELNDPKSKRRRVWPAVEAKAKLGAAVSSYQAPPAKAGIQDKSSARASLHAWPRQAAWDQERRPTLHWISTLTRRS